MRSSSTPCSASASGSATPSWSRSARAASTSSSPAAALEPSRLWPKRAPSSSAQSTSVTVSGGCPEAASARMTSRPASTPSAPSSQPPSGTESRWLPSATTPGFRPGSVAHRLPAVSSPTRTGSASKRSRSHPRAVAHTGVQATRCAPRSSEVSAASSRSSATVRAGSRASTRHWIPRARAATLRRVDERALAERLITYDTSTHRRAARRPRASSRAGSRRARSRSQDHDFNGLPVLTADGRAAPTGPTIVLHGHLDVVPGRAGAVRAARRGRPADTAAAPTT